MKTIKFVCKMFILNFECTPQQNEYTEFKIENKNKQ